MPNFGDSGAPSGGSGWFDDVSGNSQYWSKFTSFPGGIVSDIFVYVGGQGGSTTGKVCLWQGNTLWYTGSSMSIPAGSDIINGQGYLHVSGLSLYVPNGDLSIGIWTPGSVVWTFDSSGSTFFVRGLSSGPTGAGSPGGTDGTGQMYAYVVYTPSQAWVNEGSPGSPNWVAGPVSVNQGTPGSPNWVAASEVAAQTGPANSPIWTPGS